MMRRCGRVKTKMRLSFGHEYGLWGLRKRGATPFHYVQYKRKRVNCLFVSIVSFFVLFPSTFLPSFLPSFPLVGFISVCLFVFNCSKDKYHSPTVLYCHNELSNRQAHRNVNSPMDDINKRSARTFSRKYK